jgi:hypothetical protein
LEVVQEVLHMASLQTNITLAKQADQVEVDLEPTSSHRAAVVTKLSQALAWVHTVTQVVPAKLHHLVQAVAVQVVRVPILSASTVLQVE